MGPHPDNPPRADNTVETRAVDPHSAEKATLISGFDGSVGSSRSASFGEPLAPEGGERDLGRLLAGLAPQLSGGEYVFCTVSKGALPVGVTPRGCFEEPEGTTVIVERTAAARFGLHYTGCYRQITLMVHSSLEAVGLLAAVTRALADAGIPCNAVSAYHHDHLFVPVADVGRALAVLTDLTRAH